MVAEIQFDLEGWRSFLSEWDMQARELMPRLPPDPYDPVTKEFISRGSILQEGAGEEDIDRAASKLALDLPESLKRFYRASNGLIVPMLDLQHARIVAVEQLSFYRDNEPSIVIDREADPVDMSEVEYRRYGRAQNPLKTPSKYFRGLVQLCKTIDSAVLVMSPEVVTAHGEWEAWHIAHKAPGIFRYPTFEAMMVQLRDQTLTALRSIV